LKRPPARTLLLLAVSLVFAVPAHSQEQQRGDASLRLEYQYIRTGPFFSDGVKYDYWTTNSQVLLLSGDYALNDRWTIFASLPYVRKQFHSEVDWGGDPHNPNEPYWINFIPPDKRYWDDGAYHGALQDFSIGASYRIAMGPWTLSPHIGFGVPASDYPFFAKAAVGANLWTVPVGSSFSYVPYFSDWHFAGDVAYVFSEKPLGVNVDYWRANLSAGYWFKASLSVEAFLGLKYVREGVSLNSPLFYVGDPNDYPAAYDTEAWWHHDRMIRHRILNFGIGVDYFFNREWKVSGSGYQSIWTDESNEVDFAYTLALTRFFGDD
jgi:hypothetical protein